MYVLTEVLTKQVVLYVILYSAKIGMHKDICVISNSQYTHSICVLYWKVCVYSGLHAIMHSR